MEEVQQAGKTDTLMTSAEVCSELRVTAKTLQNWRRAGRLRGLRTPGGYLRYRPEDVKAVLEEA